MNDVGSDQSSNASAFVGATGFPPCFRSGLVANPTRRIRFPLYRHDWKLRQQPNTAC